MIDESELAKELTATLDRDNQRADNNRMRLRPVTAAPLTPTGIAKAVEAATNEDTKRSTRAMLEQMEIIISSIERDIEAEDQVRSIVVERIQNLRLSLDAAKAATEILRRV